jgi:hypothetical protein
LVKLNVYSSILFSYPVSIHISVRKQDMKIKWMNTRLA